MRTESHRAKHRGRAFAQAVIAGLVTLLFGVSGVLAAQADPDSPSSTVSALPSDTPAHFEVVTSGFDYTRREVMIPMRDGVHLHTFIMIPRGAQHAPMLLDRTPYSAANRVTRFNSPHLAAAVPPMMETAVAAGYIIVYQDVRGKYGSEGDYVMTRPLRGPLNPTAVDHATDTYDTIDWLVKNVPESNGRVGTIGGSYEGFTTLMSTVHPHPALKVAVPFSPMVDGWMGDDWFHQGAFRQDGRSSTSTIRKRRARTMTPGGRARAIPTRRSCARARPAPWPRPTVSISWGSGAPLRASGVRRVLAGSGAR